MRPRPPAWSCRGTRVCEALPTLKAAVHIKDTYLISSKALIFSQPSGGSRLNM